MEINLRDILDESQFYVAETSEEFGLDVKAVKHDVATDTCYEKANLLGWESERVVKSVFLYKGAKFYAFVIPELDRTLDNNLIKRIFSSNKKIKKQMIGLRNSRCPFGMEKGTCTPFVPDYYFDEGDYYTGFLEKIFIHDIPKLEKEIVDISIGGEGENYHKISLHLPYGNIYKILNYKFGERIQKINFFENV